MTKHVLVLTGSPRKNGNTNALAEAFAEGAREKGHTVQVFSAAQDAVLPCKCCDGCWESGFPCAFEDGFRRLGPLLEQAEVLALFSPVYWSGFSAQIKAPLDKLYAYSQRHSPPKKLAISQSLLFACGEGKYEENIDSLVANYHNIIVYTGWQNAGVLAAPFIRQAGAVRDTPWMEKARAMGAGL